MVITIVIGLTKFCNLCETRPCWDWL